MTLFSNLKARFGSNRFDKDVLRFSTTFVTAMPGKFCFACGNKEAAVRRLHEELCTSCNNILRAVPESNNAAIQKHGPYHKDYRGPNFGASYFTGDTTLGYGLHIVETPAEAMAYAMRIAERNAWKLLRVDIQSSLVDLFRDSEYPKYFYGTAKKSPLAYNVDQYGPITVLWRT